MDAVAELAAQAEVPMVVRDGKVLLGASVGDPEDTAPMDFDPDTNIVSLDTTNGEDSDDQPDPPVRNTLDLTVLGHPKLRVGQLARVTGLDDVPAGPWRISQVVHRFGISAGYTAKVSLISADPGQPAKIATGVQGAVNRVRDVIARAQDDHPAIDVGEVTSYAPGSDGQARGDHALWTDAGRVRWSRRAWTARSTPDSTCTTSRSRRRSRSTGPG